MSIGIASINENLDDVLKFKPKYKPIMIVKPDLENPGRIAIDWTIPINSAFLNVILLSDPFIKNFDKNIIIDKIR